MRAAGVVLWLLALGLPATGVAARVEPVTRITEWKAVAPGVQVALVTLCSQPENVHGTVWLRVRRTDRRGWRDVEIGRGWPFTASLRVCPLVGGPGRQAVVTLYQQGGAVDGTRVVVLALRGGKVGRLHDRRGLEGAHAEKAHGGWRIAEDWERSEFRLGGTLGTGEDIGNGVVRRWLRWNGRAFVPDRPGRSRVVPASSAGLPSVYRYLPQRCASFVDRPRGARPVVRVRRATRTDPEEGGRDTTVGPTGRFLYASAGAYAYVSQYRIGRGGVLTPLRPPDVGAHSHPGSITFGPGGRFAYVSCSHGAICQYRVARTGQLVPLQPTQVYGEDDPSGLRFDRSGRYAFVVADARKLDASGAAVDVDYRTGGYVYRVEDDGTLTYVRQALGHDYSTEAPVVRARWRGK